MLIVDDQEPDRAMLIRLFNRLSLVNRVESVVDGQEAIRYLNGDGPYADRNRYGFPAVMFLDLGMPVIDGWGVLDWIKGVSLKGKMRVFIHSQLRNVEEVKRLYELGADSFLKKPVEESEFRNLMQHFSEPWQISPAVSVPC
ncbi:MAG TPA: response regulator [Candidatus Saccharimonadales bacterium]|nr:response regulator [Candidatus Saccharimonadales bacterium]